MPTNKKATSKKVAKDASKEMKSPKPLVRSVAASDLTQRNSKKETSEKVASKAGKILRNPNSTKREKEVAASDLAQTPAKKTSAKKSKK